MLRRSKDAFQLLHRHDLDCRRLTLYRATPLFGPQNNGSLFYDIYSQTSELVAAFTFLFAHYLLHSSLIWTLLQPLVTEAKTIIPIPSGVILC